MKLEISLHASQLKNVAGAFQGISDPFAVVTQIATTPGTDPKVLGKTEVYVPKLNHSAEIEHFSPFEFFSFSITVFKIIYLPIGLLLLK
jgi:hypothetical protein